MSFLKALSGEVWRPLVPASANGEPLATQVNDLFLNFPYDRLPEDKLIALLMRPEVVIALIVCYLISKPAVAGFRDAFGINPASSSFRSIIAVHNLALAVFSGVTAWNSSRIVFQHYFEYGFLATYCDTEKTLWHNGLGAWSTIFYISKYYEFVDTWILVLKGKPASFLQVYHHTGIAYMMWAGVASQSAWLSIVVVLNSCIHTIMYTYFFMKTASPSTEIKAARYLTMAQIGQFYTGIAISLGIFALGSDCASESSLFALTLLHLYAYGLIALFFSFARCKYKKLD